MTATDQLLAAFGADSKLMAQAIDGAAIMGPQADDTAIGAFSCGTIAGIYALVGAAGMPGLAGVELQEAEFATIGTYLRGVLDADGGSEAARRWWRTPRGACPHGCAVTEPYGFVPAAGCPTHDGAGAGKSRVEWQTAPAALPVLPPVRGYPTRAEAEGHLTDDRVLMKRTVTTYGPRVTSWVRA